MTAALFGHGPLERWLTDPDVVEVMVNAGDEVWVERRSGVERHTSIEAVGRLAPGVLEAIIERFLAPVGRRLDRASPIVDARLADGSRVCAVLSPVAVDGACLAVRKFADDPIELDAFAGHAVIELLAAIVARRCNVLVTGATSSGKTTLLNALSACIADGERVVCIEDTAELRLRAAHVLRLETRPPSLDGLGALDLSDLLRAALRLRPDRLVIGEIRGGEAVHLLQALNTGHDGSLSTLHANSPTDALARLESLVVREAPGWPLAAVRDQVRRSTDVIVHVARSASGQRAITDVVEVGRPGEADVRTLSHGGQVVAELCRGRR